MANGRSEQLGQIGAGLLKFGAGALRAEPGRGRIAPTLSDRLQGAFGATSAVQEFEAGRAGIENIQARTGLREAQTGQIVGEEERQSRPIDIDDAIRQFGVDPASETGQFVKDFIAPFTDPNTNTVEMRDAFDALQRFNNTPTAHAGFFQKRLLDADATIKKQGETLQSLLEKATKGQGTVDVLDTETVKKIVAGSNDIKLSSAFIDFQRAQQAKQQVLSAMGAKQASLTPSTSEIIAAETDPAIAAALETKQQQKIDVAKASVEVKAEARADLPIPTNELVKFVDENGFFPPANLTPNLAQELGFFPISEQSKKQVQAIGNVGEIVAEMQPITDRLFQAKGFWDRVTGAFPNLQAYFLQEGNEQLVVDAAQYMAMKHGVAGQFSKVVSGEGGRLTEQDIQRVLGLFPNFFNRAFLADTKAVADRKMQFLSKRLEDERRRILKRDGIKPTGKLIEAEANLADITPTETPEQLIDIGDRDLSTMSIEELIELKKKVDNDFGLRQDGTPKGTGFLGILDIVFPDGSTGVATEYSVNSHAVKADGKLVDFPVLVPTLTQSEIDLMVKDIMPNGKQPPQSIMQKAVDHANKRIAQGLSPFK